MAMDPDAARAISAFRGDLAASPIHPSHATRLVEVEGYLVERCERCAATRIGELFRRCAAVVAA